MNIDAFLAGLQARGVRLYPKAGGLAAEAENGVLDEALLGQIRARKQEILEQIGNGTTSLPSRSAGDMLLQPSIGQEQLWLQNRLGDDRAYHLPAFLQIDGELDVPALQTALQDVVARHDALRMRIDASAEGPQASLCDAGSFHMERREIADDSTAVGMARALMEKRFDLATDFPIRATLMHLNNRRHFLVLILHHICCDGLSIRLLIDEIGARYTALCNAGDTAANTAALLAPAPSFADFAAWQRQQSASAASDTHRNYWQKQLTALPAAASLPGNTDNAENVGGAVAVEIDQALSDAVDRYARQSRSTPFAILLSALASLLARYQDNDDIVIGSPLANRLQAQWQNVVGFVANTVPLRLAHNGDQSFAELTRQTQNRIQEALAHAALPFEQILRIIDDVSEIKSAGRSPFQVMFAMQPAAARDFALPGLEVRALPLDAPRVKFDLTVLVEELPQGRKIVFEYRAGKFEHAFIEDVAHRYMRLLQQLIATPNQPLRTFTLTDDADWQSLHDEWRRDMVHTPAEPVHTLFFAQAARTPNAIAIASPDGDLSYGALSAQIRNDANALYASGVRIGDRVAICLPPSPRFVSCALAAQTLGAAYLPLDPAYPLERLQMMLEEAHPAALITANTDLRPFHDRALLTLDDLDKHACASAAAPLVSPGQAMDLPLYLIFTSGSTGRPKGAVVTQRNFVNLLNWYIKEFGFHGYTRILLLSALSFDLTQKNLFAPLLTGGALVIRSQARFDAHSVLDDVARQRISVLNCTPTMFYAVLEAAAADQWQSLETLTQVFLGGEPIAAAPLRDWLLKARQRTEIVNTYGPTECTDVCAFKRLPTSWDHWPSRAPIGKAVSGCTLLAVDANDRLVAPGMVGELLIGGAGVGPGYFNDAEQTARRFVSLPFGRPGERFYRSGDLVRRDMHGDYLFIGRRDQQVKLRGLRLELEEIESALERQTGVARAAAIVKRGDAGDERLEAFVVMADGCAFAPAALLNAIRSSLPDYAVPQALTALSTLPLTPSGKVDRIALSKIDSVTTSHDNATADAAQGPLETLIAELWADILQRPQVGRHDSFFDIGGHSLLATRMVARLVNQHHLPATINDVFDAPRVADLAQRLADRAATTTAPEPIHNLPRTQHDPGAARALSQAQQRLFFLNRVEGPSAAYNMSIALHMRGVLDPVALLNAFRRLVDRHPVLSVSFLVDADEIRQRPGALKLDSLLATPIETSELANTIAAIVNRPFDLEHEPALRIKLLQIAPEHHVLALSLHHLICDGWSAGLLEAELGSLYAAARQLPHPPLPTLPMTYFDYADWHREWLSTSRLEALSEYWKEHLSALPELSEIPTDQPRPAVAMHVGAVRHFEIQPAVAAGLSALARAQHASLFMVVLAAFQLLTARLSQRDDVVVGSPLAGRARPELESLIGLFVNTLVLRQTVDETQSIAAFIASVRRTLLDAYAHQDMPFEKLVELLRPQRSLAHTPLFQILFVMDTGELGGLTMPDLTVERIDIAGVSAKYDLNVHLIESGNSLKGYIEYDCALYNDDTIARIAEMYGHVLSQFATPEAAAAELSSISLTSPALAAELATLSAPLAGAYELPLDTTVSALVRSAATRWPDRIALQDGVITLDFATLQMRADALANRLVALDLPRGATVGVMMPRGHARATALLGVLCAAYAYVPLDPDWPVERVRQIIELTGVSALLSERSDVSAALHLTIPLINTTEHIRSDSGTMPCKQSPAPDDLAYVITTSGSTGVPKSVMVRHRGVAHDLAFLAQARGVTPDSRILQITNFNFDPSVRDLFGAWAAGATAVLLSDADAWDPARLLERLHDDRIDTIFSITPTLLRSILNLAETRGLRDARRTAGFVLHTLMPCGERLTAQDCRRAWNVFGSDLHIVNQYGPTEATMTSTNHEVRPEDLLRLRIPVGRPNPNTQCWILDSHRREVPVGAIGEVYIDGIGVGPGYMNDPVRTQEAFLPNPFDSARTIGKTLYRSGDLGRRLADGTVDLIGRIDSQLKIHGNRVEPGEIEAVLMRLDGVLHAAVAVHPDAMNEPRLDAYVVLETPRVDATRWLRGQIAGQLPAYMVPATVQTLDAMPLTITGKIDRRRLPLPLDRHLVTQIDNAETASTAIQHTIAAIWASVLGGGSAQHLDIHSNFFDLGGNSMRLIAVQAAIERELGQAPRVVDLFQHTTIASLAAHLDATRNGATTDATLFSSTESERVARRRQGRARRSPPPSHAGETHQ